MIIGLANYEFINHDLKHNYYKIIEGLKTEEVDYLFFGEAYLHGFDGLSWNVEKDLNFAITQSDPLFVDIKRMCKLLSKGIGFGYYEKENEYIYCSYIVIDKHGEVVCNYRRQSSGWKYPNSAVNYVNGTQGAHFSLEGKTFDLLLCGDGWDDNILESYKGKSDYLLWPLYVNFDIFSELNDYKKRVRTFYDDIFIIGSLSKKPKSSDGSFYLSKDKTLSTIESVEETIIIEI